MTKHLARLARVAAAAVASTATVVTLAGCPDAPKDKPPGAEGEGEGEGDGVVFDCPSDAHADSLDEMATRYAADLDPLMTRASGGCIACHAADSGRLMTLADTPESSFFRIRASGFFRLVNGGIPERVIHESMPQGGPAWSQDEKDLLLDFACDLASLDDAGIPPDEEFPPELLAPYTGPANTDWDDTFLTFNQLRGRVLESFDDDWVRLGVDQFSENISLFGGADFVNTFVPARDATPEFFVGLDLLAEDVCARAAADGTGPFAGLDLDAAIVAEPPPQLLSFEAETAQITGLPDGCLPGANSTNVVLCTNATTSSSFTAPIGGDYTIVVRAKGDEAVSADDTDLPHMEVKVDSDVAEVFDVPEAPGFQDYTVTVHVDPGSHILAVSFTNDCCGTGNDRNLFVDRYSINGPLPGTTNGSATGPADAKANLEQLFRRMLLREPVVGGADDEIEPLYSLLIDLQNFDGNLRGAYSGACEGLFQHPDFLFTRPPAFDTATGGDRERMLVIKTALDLVDRPPTSSEFGLFDSGASREDLVDTWLTSDEFAQAYNTRIRAVLEFDGTPDGDEPSRLWTYVMKNDRPLKEILTADYTVDEEGNQVSRDPEHGATGLLTMKGYIKGKPGLPHYNYAARVFTGFLGVVFNVPQEALDARATATAASTVDPASICFSCHRLLTPLAYQRQKWDDDGNFRDTYDDGRVIDDTDNSLVADYPFKGPGIESFSLVAVRKEGFVRRMANVHYQFAFGRNMRHDEDERDVYLQLWNAVNSGNGTFKDVMKQVLFSRMYTNPNPPTEGGAP